MKSFPSWINCLDLLTLRQKKRKSSRFSLTIQESQLPITILKSKEVGSAQRGTQELSYDGANLLSQLQPVEHLETLTSLINRLCAMMHYIITCAVPELRSAKRTRINPAVPPIFCLVSPFYLLLPKCRKSMSTIMSIHPFSQRVSPFLKALN